MDEEKLLAIIEKVEIEYSHLLEEEKQGEELEWKDKSIYL